MQVKYTSLGSRLTYNTTATHLGRQPTDMPHTCEVGHSAADQHATHVCGGSLGCRPTYNTDATASLWMADGAVCERDPLIIGQSLQVFLIFLGSEGVSREVVAD